MNATTLLLLAPLAVGHPPANCAPCAAGPAFPAMVTYPPFPQPCPPIGPPAPVLAAKVVVPPGVTVGVGGKTYPAGTQFGFRPGYRYRITLSRPGLTLYPQIEILGSIVPRNGLNYLDFPATFAFSEQELRHVAAGALLTKVVYLEDPTKAVPVASTPDRPIEIAEPSAEEAWKVASENGRIVAVIKLGDRVPDAAELAGIANTILHPGDKALGPAAAPALFTWNGVPLFDPVIGPKPPIEECLTDGGDKKTVLGIGPDGKAHGLDPTDVSAEYTQGTKRKVTTSNEVCICSPRFVARTAEATSSGMRAARRLGTEFAVVVHATYGQETQAQAVLARDRTAEIDARVRPSLALTVDRLAAFVRGSRPIAVAATKGTLVVVAAKEADEITSYPDQLVVTKSVEPKSAVQIGGVVTVTIRFVNRTKDPIQDLVISDSLSGRLEYVSGSAKSDRPTNVTTAPNEAGSVAIRFEVPGVLQPGQGGVVTFQVKVR
jgi:uncharacterized repeat protein (TIGR01451 family)